MRQPDLDRLAGFVRLRTLQARDAEAEAAQAAADSRAQRALAQSAAARLDGYRSGWQDLTARGHYDHEAATRWAEACQSEAAVLDEQVLAADGAEAREHEVRQAWHIATLRVDQAETDYGDARRTWRHRLDEAEIHRAVERHVQRARTVQ